MYYLVVLSVLAGFFNAFFWKNKSPFFSVFFICAVGIFLLGLHYFYIVDLLHINNNALFFPKIGDIDVFAFVSRSPMKGIEIVNILFSVLVTVVVFITFPVFFYKDCLSERFSIITTILVFVSILFITLAFDMFQLIMSWLFISAVLYYAINSKEHDASEIDNVLYTSVLLVVSDALFITGIIAVTYADFASQNGIAELLEWQFMWLMNPLGSVFIILAVIFKSSSVGLNNWINSILYDDRSNIIQTYIYSIYISLVGAIVLLHVSYYILQSTFVLKIAIFIFFLDMLLNLLRSFLDVNLNRIVVCFCLSNFNYIFISFFLGYKEYFIQLIVIQLALSILAFIGSAFLVKAVETNDIRKINFNIQDKGLIIFSIISIIFLPQISIYLFTQVDINKIMFFGIKNNVIAMFVLVFHSILSFLVVLRVFIIMLLYENEQELLLLPDFGKIFKYFISISSCYLLIVIFQSYLINDIISAVQGDCLFNLMYLLYFVLFSFIAYDIIGKNKIIYGNLHCMYPNVFLSLQNSISLQFILHLFSFLLNYVYSISILIYTSLSNFAVLSDIFYSSMYFINNNLNKLQQVNNNKIFIVLAMLLFTIFICTVRMFT